MKRGRGFRLKRQNLNAVVASTSRELNLAILATLLTPTTGESKFLRPGLINRAHETTVFLPCFFFSSPFFHLPLSFFDLHRAGKTVKQAGAAGGTQRRESSRSVTNEVFLVCFSDKG